MIISREQQEYLGREGTARLCYTVIIIGSSVEEWGEIGSIT
jgi:hypothetical protein